MEETPMTEAYKSALAAVREATAKFDAIRNDYRAMKIGDAEFLSAKAEYEATIPKFDEAYGEEANLAENNQQELRRCVVKGCIFSATVKVGSEYTCQHHASSWNSYRKQCPLAEPAE
jgi:hypothetical protein